MTRAEELASLNAAQALRKPRVDPFEQSRLDQLEHARLNKLPKVVTPPPAIKKGFTGGIPKVDKALKDAGVDD